MRLPQQPARMAGEGTPRRIPSRRRMDLCADVRAILSGALLADLDIPEERGTMPGRWMPPIGLRVLRPDSGPNVEDPERERKKREADLWHQERGRSKTSAWWRGWHLDHPETDDETTPTRREP